MEPSDKVMNGRDSVQVALAQTPPVYLDRSGTVEKALGIIERASRDGAELLVFPEAWIAGYPYWGEGWESELEKWVPVRTQFYDNAMVIPGEDARRLEQAAMDQGIHVVLGCNEMDPRPESQTIYNTLLFIDRERGMVGRHRKTMPTFVERAIWGNGDGSTLVAYETDIGRIGGLICGEHLMTPLRAHMARQGIDFHVSVFPGAFSVEKGPKLEEVDRTGHECWGHVLTRAHALEAGCYVLSSCGYMDEDSLPDDFPLSDTLNIDYARGGSSVVGPLGSRVEGPEHGDTILHATCGADTVKVWKALIDTAGHYARPDIVEVNYHPEPYQQVTRAVEQTSPGELRRIADRHDVSTDDLEKEAREATNLGGGNRTPSEPSE